MSIENDGVRAENLSATMTIYGSPSSSVRLALPPLVTKADFREILGIRFYVGQLPGLLELTKQGGLVAVPSAPVLTHLTEDDAHRTAVEGCDFAITDSGFMVLLWLALKRDRLVRISGLRYLQALLDDADFRRPSSVFWVMPSEEDARANLAWLKTQGLEVSADDSVVAPRYNLHGPLEDATLLLRLEQRRPQFVVLCLGGGVQERLGFYLRRNLSFGPAIICTGAAIAFLSGRQANIPKWADRLFLGWLFRLLSEPRRFLPRYRRALRLPCLVARHGEKSVANHGT